MKDTHRNVRKIFVASEGFVYVDRPLFLSFFYSDTLFGLVLQIVKELRNRLSKDVDHLAINDLVEAEPTNALAEAVGGEAVLKPIEGSGNQIVIDLFVSMIGVRPILETIHRVSQQTKFRVCDCQFEFI